MSFSYKKQTHKSKGKAGRIPHPVGASPHSGARKNKLQKALEAREDKVGKQRKKSKGGVGYTAIGAAAGAIPFAGAASKAIPAIAKGVKTIKAGMKASKAKNPRGAMQQINPKSSLIKPSKTKTKVKKKNEGEQYLEDLETGGYQEKMMEPPNMPKRGGGKVYKMGGGKVMKKNMGGPLKAVNNPGLAKLPTPVRNKMGFAKGGGKVEYKMGGGKVMGYKKGGPITYRMSGGQVVDNSYD